MNASQTIISLPEYIASIRHPLELFKIESALPIESYEKFYRDEKMDPNEKDEDGDTILHWIVRDFAEYGLILDDRIKHFLEMLLRYGLDINVKNNRGETALHEISRLAVSKKYCFELVCYFMEKGADPTLPNAVRKLPFSHDILFQKSLWSKWKK